MIGMAYFVLQSQIIQSSVQSSTQLVGIIACTSEKNEVASSDSSESQAPDDLLMLTTFVEHALKSSL